ncbi:unnamed protein product [Rodentolepis nana]|uniref:Endo/exonuclease/phosphatase domain-containing protein n=1 Tax=Rodentolepis nana TaxID=102285 RepID=A0A0R3T4A9_RODNA|nr:unnamed protein product [Rodentolepis nana]
MSKETVCEEKRFTWDVRKTSYTHKIRLNAHKRKHTDPATYLHYNGTRTTPDLLLASTDISEHTHSTIIDDSGSDHKPIIASIAIGTKENELHPGPLTFNQHPDKLCCDITNFMIRCAKETILRGKTKHYRVFWFEHHKHYRVFWSKHLEEAKRKRDALRNTADQYWKRDALRNTADQTGRTDALCNTADLTERTEVVQAWRQQSAVLRQAIQPRSLFQVLHIIRTIDSEDCSIVNLTSHTYSDCILKTRRDFEPSN